ncbi:MAG: hypothetical protein R3F43_24425 [bacterium]
MAAAGGRCAHPGGGAGGGAVGHARELRAGRAFSLWDGSTLLVRMPRGRLPVVVLDGVALAPAGEAEEAVRTAGGLLLAAGILGLVGRADHLRALDLGWPQVVGGGLLLALGLLPVSRGRLWAALGLTLASALVAAWQIPSGWAAAGAVVLLGSLAARMLAAVRRAPVRAPDRRRPRS